MTHEALLDALDELNVSDLTEAHLSRLADIVERLQLHIEQEFMDRDDPPED